jgi:hypothetical protein
VSQFPSLLHLNIEPLQCFALIPRGDKWNATIKVEYFGLTRDAAG